MRIKEVSLSSPIEEKINWAESVHRELGSRLQEEEPIATLLNGLQKAALASRREMVRIGIVEVCRACEQDEGGSCCGVGMENRVDHWLLLVNLLLGVALPQKSLAPGSCFLLGEKGCLLQARQVICINYLCSKITTKIDPREIMALREKEGEEIHILFDLCERLKKTIRAWTST